MVPSASITVISCQNISVVKLSVILRAVVVWTAVSICALAGAQFARADLSAEDRQFLATLESIGWKITNPAGLTEQARMVCNEGLAHGVSLEEIRTQLKTWGYSAQEASALIDNSVRVYCPKYAAAVTGSTPSAPRGGQGDTFVEILQRQRGITMDSDAAANMAKVACEAPIAGVGLYDAQRSLQQRYPQYDLSTVATVMSVAVLTYCPERLP